jgi:anti-sigma regulatory factor (Ser/Thr protein kinase)
MLIELKNDLGEIGRLAAELELFCDQEELPVKTCLELNLVLEELVTNTISYGYSDHLSHLIRVDLQRQDDRVKVTIEDDGAEFNPLEAPPPHMSEDIDDLEPGGLGIHLVRELTDEAEYSREDGYNRLVLIKVVL